MLGMLNKKELAARAKKMKETAHAFPAKDLKLKVVVEPAEHFASDGRTPSPQAPPPISPPSRDIVVQESVGVSVPEGGLWDPTLDAPSFLEKILLSAKAKEKLESLEEDQLVELVVKQLG